MNVYPVPAAKKIWVNTSNVSGNYTITNQTGKVVWKNKPLPDDGIDVSSLNAGVYFISVMQNGTTQTRRFIV